MNAMKIFGKFALIWAFSTLFVLPAAAQSSAVRLPRPSQKASVMQTVGVTDISITYSRPAIKGRRIWGDPTADEKARVKGAATLDDQNARPKDAPIVPYGHVWRTGANEATVFTVSDDVMINGQKLAAGTYSLHTIPTKNEWTIIFNSDAGQWGSFRYDEAKDVLRVKATPQTVGDSQEALSFGFPSVTSNSAQVLIRWEKVAVPFTVEVPNVAALVQTKIESAMAANPTEWKIPLSLAGQFAGSDEWDKALAWTDKSIKIKETFQNLSSKTQYLYAAGRKDEAKTLAPKALAQGKAEQADTSRFEKWLLNMK